MSDYSLNRKHYLFAVLNWGLGHASRSIPIIKDLLAQGQKVTLASDGVALELLKMEFPDLEIIEIPAYRINYGRSLPAIVFKNSINVFLAIIREHLALKQILKNRHFDCVISDSRFGFYSKNVPSYIISHQLSIPINNSLLNYFVNRINSFFINRFDQCWIPDEEDRRLSGIMSLNARVKNKKYIGIQSRLTKKNSNAIYDLHIILSGPEPSRSILEKKLLLLLKDSKLNIALVRGTNKDSTLVFPVHWKVCSLANSSQLEDLLSSSKKVLSRSGYSSIMDYYILGIPAQLIPTPGQSEQEYLAEYLDGKYGFRCVAEDELSQLLLDFEIM